LKKLKLKLIVHSFIWQIIILIIALSKVLLNIKKVCLVVVAQFFRQGFFLEDLSLISLSLSDKKLSDVCIQSGLRVVDFRGEALTFKVNKLYLPCKTILNILFMFFIVYF
jgi:hypothetical protein